MSVYTEIRPADGSVQKRKRKGRGNASGMGGECGRGHKGQKARSGGKIRTGFEGGQTPLYRRLPKKRGQFSQFRISFLAINLETLDKYFGEAEEVTPVSLHQKGLISKNQKYKILGNGTIKKLVKIQAHAFSASALEKIQKADCQIELIG